MTIRFPKPCNRTGNRAVAAALTLALAGLAGQAVTVAAPPAMAGQVEIVAVQADAGAGDTYGFSVTLRHADTGWDHYADKWDIRAPDGTVLGTRVLVHPHVNEQPFTRSLLGVSIPRNLRQVVVRARDNVHGLSPQKYVLDLPER